MDEIQLFLRISSKSIAVWIDFNMPRLGCNLDAKVGKWVGRLVLNFSSSSLLANR